MSDWQEPVVMDDATKPRITDRDLVGLKYFEKLRPLFARLHEVGCQRDQAGNRGWPRLRF